MALLMEKNNPNVQQTASVNVWWFISENNVCDGTTNQWYLLYWNFRKKNYATISETFFSFVCGYLGQCQPSFSWFKTAQLHKYTLLLLTALHSVHICLLLVNYRFKVNVMYASHVFQNLNKWCKVRKHLKDKVNVKWAHLTGKNYCSTEVKNIQTSLMALTCFFS